MIKIIYEDNHLLVVEKPFNIPTQEDNSKDKDLLNILKEDLKKRYNKPGRVYLGLIHRLDRPAGGLMVFAKTSKAASRMFEQIIDYIMEKKYYIIVDGPVLNKSGDLNDFLLKDTKTNISSVVKENTVGAKEGILSFRLIETNKNLNLVEVKIKTGRSHQIRVQMAHHNMPLYGDNKYNEKSQTGEQLALFAYSLSFYHPITKEKLNFKLNTPNTYPWTLFKNSL